MKFSSFEDLFNQLFTEAYLVEQHGIKIMTKMVDKAHSTALRSALNTHLEETREQATRLEHILKQENVKIGEDRVCPIDTIVEEAEKCLVENYPSPLLDAAIIAFVQQIEHVEIAIYGTLKDYADQLHESSIKKTVSQTLREEAKTDTLLTRLAMGGFFKEGINVRATG